MAQRASFELPLSRAGQLPRASPWRVMARAATWALVGAWLVAAVALDRLAGRRGPARFGARLRELFQRAGGTGIKLAQQLSIRVDLLPHEVCDELALLVDKVPPIPRAEVEGLVERGLGRPVAEAFARFDVEPIGSGSVACVYSAWLPDGRRVAVKVRRPDVALDFAADLAVLEMVFWLLEASTVMRSGTFRHLEMDLRMLLGEETSFWLESRYQRMFARALDGKGMPWMVVPEVLTELSSDSVLVTEFVEGVPVAELLAARESSLSTSLEAWKERGIDVGIVARRLVRFAMWARFETLFFHADPHPGNVFVLPGNRIVLIDFGGCGSTSRRTRRNHLEVVRHIVHPDEAAISRIALSDLSPLPHFDTEEFRLEIEARFRALSLAVEDPSSHWSERMAASAWIDMLEITRKYQIRINLDTVRSIRAFLLYDTLAFRLEPRLGTATLARYLRDVAARRAHHAVARPMFGEPLPDGPEELLALGERLVARGDDLVTRLLPQVEAVQHQVRAFVRRASLAARAALQLALIALAVTAAVLSARAASISFEPSPRLLVMGGALGALGAVIAVRRGLFTLARVGDAKGTGRSRRA